MTKIQYLRHQADKADRLAQTGLDPLTVARLASFSQEYRLTAETLEHSAGPADEPPARGLPVRLS